jgi:hypothetical protein
MTALEHKTWTDAIHAATAYRPKEAAQHSQRAAGVCGGSCRQGSRAA